MNVNAMIENNCSVPGCENSADDKFLKFYSLPYKDEEVCREWINRIENPKLCLQHEGQLPIHKICEIHFHYICKTGLNSQLHKYSLPTLYLPNQKHKRWRNCFLESLATAGDANQIHLNEDTHLRMEDCSEICTVCYSKGILYNIHESKYKEQLIATLIQTLVNEKVRRASDLRTHMCLGCIRLLIISNLMTQKIKQSNLIFSSLSAVKGNSKKKVKTKLSGQKSFLVTYPPKIDLKSILSDCDLKIKTNKYTNYKYVTNNHRYNDGIDIKDEVSDLEQLSDLKLSVCDSEVSSHNKRTEHIETNAFNKIENGDAINQIGDISNDNFDIDKEGNTAFDRIDIKFDFKEENSVHSDFEVLQSKIDESDDTTSEEENMFICSDCSSRFASDLLLQQHMNTSHPIFCIICGKTYKSKKTLQAHWECHKRTKKNECKICQKQCKSITGLTNHIKCHEVNYYAFLTNGKTDGVITDLKRNKGRLCHICGKVVPCMKIHMYQHLTGSRKFKCQFCEYTTYIKSVMKRHEDAHRGARDFLCTECGRVSCQTEIMFVIITIAFSSKLALGDHTKDHEHLPVPIQCLYCEETFNTKYERQMHSQRHGVRVRPMTEPKLYVKTKPSICPQCGMTFGTDTYLQVHLKNAHNVVDAECFSCQYCDEKFTSGYRRTYHVSREHRRKEKPKSTSNTRSKALPRFTCSVCSKRERTKSSLRVHMRIHTGERPYKCEICSSAFKQQQQLKNHKRRMHVQERPFPCKLCDRAFSSSQELSEHCRTHTGETVQCEHCDKTFKQRSNRSKHMREVHNIRMRGKYARDKIPDNDIR